MISRRQTHVFWLPTYLASSEFGMYMTEPLVSLTTQIWCQHKFQTPECARSPHACAAESNMFDLADVTVANVDHVAHLIGGNQKKKKKKKKEKEKKKTEEEEEEEEEEGKEEEENRKGR